MTWLLIFSISCLIAFLSVRSIRKPHVEARAIRGLEELGIKVALRYKHEFQQPYVPNSGLPIPPGPSWFKAIFGEMALARIECVALEGEIKTLDGSSNFLTQLTHLKTLDVKSSKLANVDALKHLKGLKRVFLNGCASDSLKNLHGLANLQLCDVGISDCHGLTNLDSFRKIASLEGLEIFYCSGFRELDFNILETTILEAIVIEGCDRLVTVNAVPLGTESCSLGIEQCKALEKVTIEENSNMDALDISNCHQLDSIAGLSKSLLNLSIMDCHSLRTVKGRKSSNLKYVNVDACGQLTSFDVSLESAETICLNECDSIRDLNFSQPLPKLKDLYIDSCNSLVSIDDLPESVKELALIKCESLCRVTPTDNLPHLKEFHLTDCPKLSEAPVMPVREVEEKKTDSVQP